MSRWPMGDIGHHDVSDHRFEQRGYLHVPVDWNGSTVHAVVVQHPDARLTEDQVLDWCRDRIAGYKRPRSVSFIREDEMPRTATGKILHRRLRERCTG